MLQQDTTQPSEESQTPSGDSAGADSIPTAELEPVPAETGTETPPAETTPAEDSGSLTQQIQDTLTGWLDQLVTWLQSPAFLTQVAVVILSVFAGKLIARALKKRFDFFRESPAEGSWLRVKQIGYQLKDLMYPATIILLLAIAIPVLTAIGVSGAGEGKEVAAGVNWSWLAKIAQGLALVYLLFKAIKRFITHPIVQKIVLWIAIPIAVLKVLGLDDDVARIMEQDLSLTIGGISITALTLFNLAVFGSILFWLGSLSNRKGQETIRSQESIEPGTREVLVKLFQIALFGVLFLLLMNIAKIPMDSLIVVGGAVGLGIGFGLQQIAANFISGLILLLDRSLRVGDYVQLPDGRQGFVDALNMRSATIETCDGKDIMVPNVKFIEDMYENWTHKDPRQRYEVEFMVAYDTDLDALEDILMPAVLEHPQVLTDPEEPDLELREFGDFGIKMAIEFWCDGIDDGPNKFTSDIGFIIWRTLKKHGVQMPLPQREVRMLKD